MDAPKPTPAPAPATAAGPGLYADIGKKARGRMSGFGDGYVGTTQDAVKIRRAEKQREAERQKIEELKSKNTDGQPDLLQFGSSTSEILETAFKKENVGLVTREQYVEKSISLYWKFRVTFTEN
ncbi:hypothetical protein ZWY2020_043127 [Hordeum vulgare]|nr:hypothetical protein ZWY2020_043127 [Hordeum vulgare]